jgi:hypothetical protein
VAGVGLILLAFPALLRFDAERDVVVNAAPAPASA